MTRTRREFEPGSFYHIYPRGNDGRAIVIDDIDRASFLRRFERVVRRHNLIVHGYALMDNHFHGVVQLTDANLSPAMQALIGGHGRWWNQRHDSSGHLFRNHFDYRPIESQSHLIATIRYIDLNPVKAKMVARPEDSRYTSYRAHVGLEHPIGFLAQSEFLKLMGPTPDLAREAYRRFVSEGHGPVSDTGLSEWP